MATERTLAIIKPDAVRAGNVGLIFTLLERQFKIVQMKMDHFCAEEVIEFYREHEGKSFFRQLVQFMSGGDIVAIVLEGENAIAKFRGLLGNADPNIAEFGTIRSLYGTKIPANAAHGSDSSGAAKREIDLIFGKGFFQKR